MKNLRTWVVFFFILSLSGIDAPVYAAEEPTPILCTPAIEMGQSKDAIKLSWGMPERKILLEPDETGLEREAWIYTTKPFGIFNNNAYVCKTQKLVFTGGYLTDIVSGEEPLPYIKLQQGD